MKRIHDPHHVAQIAALILSSQPDPENHHIEKAVEASRSVLDEAFRRADEDEVQEQAAASAAAEASVEAGAGDGKS